MLRNKGQSDLGFCKCLSAWEREMAPGLGREEVGEAAGLRVVGAAALEGAATVALALRG